MNWLKILGRLRIHFGIQTAMNVVQRFSSRQSFVRWEFSNTGRHVDFHRSVSRSVMMILSVGVGETARHPSIYSFVTNKSLPAVRVVVRQAEEVLLGCNHRGHS